MHTVCIYTYTRVYIYTRKVRTWQGSIFYSKIYRKHETRLKLTHILDAHHVRSIASHLRGRGEGGANSGSCASALVPAYAEDAGSPLSRARAEPLEGLHDRALNVPRARLHEEAVCAATADGDDCISPGPYRTC